LRRRLDDGFDLGDWADGILEDVLDAVGLGSEDEDEDSEAEDETGDNETEDNQASINDVSDVQWGNDGAWDEWISILLNNFNGDGDGSGNGGLLNGLGDFNGDNVCPIVELALGMGAGFLVAASCDCDGDLATGLTLGCAFDQCAPGSNSGVCGAVDLSFVFGGPDGTVDMTACVDFEGDRYRETCFSYTIDVTLNNGSSSSSSSSSSSLTQNRVFDQTCEATYGGNPCECTIDNGLCLSLDCSMYVPGAKIDTCQMLTMADGIFDSNGDVDGDGNINGALESWIPGFDIFQQDFQLRADDISWEILDFRNLDFEAFDIPAIDWDGFGMGTQDMDANGEGEGENESEMTERTWMDLIGPDSNPTFLDAEGIAPGVCTLLSRVANLSDELGLEGSCVCGYDETTGLMDVSCGFSESCAYEGNNDNDNDNDNGVLTNLGDEPLEDNVDGDGNSDGGLLGLCGSVSLKLTYGSLSEIYAETCIEYSDFPETCYSYGIPLAAETIILVPGTDTGAGTDTGTDTGLGPAYNNNNNNNGENQDPVTIDVSTPASRECSARYGLDTNNNNCKCTIDLNACLTVDCTDFEPLARTDECQVVDLAGAVSPSRMVLNFQTPVEGAIVSDGDGGAFVAGAQQQSSGTSRNSNSVTTGFGAVVVLVVVSTAGLVVGQLV